MKNKRPSTSKVKQKQKWHWRAKNIYLKEVTFSTWNKCYEYFYAEIGSLFHN